MSNDLNPGEEPAPVSGAENIYVNGSLTDSSQASRSAAASRSVASNGNGLELMDYNHPIAHQIFTLTKTERGLSASVFYDEAGDIADPLNSNDDAADRVVIFSDGSFALSDFYKSHNFIGAAITTIKREYFNDLEVDEGSGILYSGRIDAEYTDVILLGGKMLGLQYSDFGVWKQQEEATAVASAPGGPDITVSASTHIDDMAFYFGDSGKRQGFAGLSGSRSFNGTAVGRAFNSYEYTIYKEVVGSAALTVDQSLSNITSLELAFDDYYTFSLNGSASVDRRGGFTASGFTVSDNGNTDPLLALTTGASSPRFRDQARGQFYGASSPEEAVGAFEFSESFPVSGLPPAIFGPGVEDNYNTYLRGVTAAFGVK
jgi:hypothetical protein